GEVNVGTCWAAATSACNWDRFLPAGIDAAPAEEPEVGAAVLPPCLPQAATRRIPRTATAATRLVLRLKCILVSPAFRYSNLKLTARPGPSIFGTMMATIRAAPAKSCCTYSW